MRNRARWLCVATALWCQSAAALSRADDGAVPADDPRLQRLYQDEANRWEMWVDPEQRNKAEIVAKPVFRWQNLARANGQSGAMYVWLFEGRPVVIGGVFSNPANGGRDIMHEFHAIDPDRLYPVLPGSEAKWTPQAGIARQRLHNSPNVETTAGKRTLQLRAIGRDFTANSKDPEEKRWELRLLPKPLYRYEKPQGDIIDGALLAFVSDAGIDPEIILILEARRESEAVAAWYYRPIRMSTSDLYVDYRGKRVWNSLRDDPEGNLGNKDQTYLLWRDRAIDEFSPVNGSSSPKPNQR